MGLLTQDEASELLGVHVQGVRNAMLAAWADYKNPEVYSDQARSLHCSTTRANCVHDHIKARISEYAETHPADLQVRTCQRMFTLVVKDMIGIRFKKLDGDLHTANQPTGQVLAFKRQEEIALIGAKHHLEVGYRLDETEQHVLGIFLLCPNGEFDNFWVWELGDQQVVAIVEDFFEAKQSRANQIEEDAVVRPKKSADVVPIKRDADNDPGQR